MSSRKIGDLIILAGGKSQRMGSPKGLITYQGERLLDYTIGQYSASGGQKIILVLGHHIKPYLDAFNLKINEWTSYRDISIKAVVNTDYHLGQFSSILMAINSIDSLDENYFFLTPVDVPFPKPETISKLNQSYTSSLMALLPSNGLRSGHPVLLSGHFLKKLKKLNPKDPGSRLDYQINYLTKEEKIFIDVDDENIIKNINTPKDL